MALCATVNAVVFAVTDNPISLGAGVFSVLMFFDFGFELIVAELRKSKE